MIKQHQMVGSKRNSVFRPAHLFPQSSADSFTNNPAYKEQMRRTSLRNYQNGSGVLTEPGSPVKPGKLLGIIVTLSVACSGFVIFHCSTIVFIDIAAGRPIPLLRRCSLPVFANQGEEGIPNYLFN